MRISELNIFPLKSARSIALSESRVDAQGLVGDRRAMLTDASGHFITQRDMPLLAQLQAFPVSGAWELVMEGKGELRAETPPADRRMDVAIWKSIVSAAVATDEINAGLSEWFDRDVRLVFFDDAAHRPADKSWGADGTPVTFADGFQVLITTTASLKALNANKEAKGEPTVGMDRFRPNIVIDQDEPWAEDRWAAIEIDGVTFDLVKPCARCIMTTQDQHTGSREGANPMPAMGRLRMSADRRVPGPLFGWNAVPRGEGILRIGDEIKVTAERPEGWAIKQR